MIPGTYCTDGSVKILVLDSSRYGFMAVKCRSFTRGQERYVDVADLPEKPLVFDVVLRTDKWRCVDVSPVACIS